MSRSHGCEKATLCADTTARRCKYVHVSSAKTSMFWKLAAASTLGLLLLRFDCICGNYKKQKDKNLISYKTQFELRTLKKIA